MPKPKQFTCACCQSKQECIDNKPQRLGRVVLCPECAANSLVRSPREVEFLRTTVRSEIVLMRDVLADPSFSKKQHAVHKEYVRFLKDLRKRLRRYRK